VHCNFEKAKRKLGTKKNILMVEMVSFIQVKNSQSMEANLYFVYEYKNLFYNSIYLMNKSIFLPK